MRPAAFDKRERLTDPFCYRSLSWLRFHLQGQGRSQTPLGLKTLERQGVSNRSANARIFLTQRLAWRTASLIPESAAGSGLAAYSERTKQTGGFHEHA